MLLAFEGFKWVKASNFSINDYETPGSEVNQVISAD